jgi:cell wall-associated NlpC family hydrolase
LRAIALRTFLTLLLGLALSAGPALAQDTTSGNQNGNGGTDASSATTASSTDQTQTPPSDNTGGAQYGPSSGAQDTPDTPVVDGFVAKILPDGLAAAPSMAPPEVQQAIWAANRIVGRPYVYGGGHNRTFRSRGYDCSGTVSYALHGGGLLAQPLDSSSFMRWGEAGQGAWMTIWTNPGHAFLIIAGVRLDTSAAGDPHGGNGPRWRPVARTTQGFHARHPQGL